MQKGIVFMPLDAFKLATGIKSFDIIRNPETNVVYALSDKGTYFKAMQDWKVGKPVTVKVENGDLAGGILIQGNTLETI